MTKREELPKKIAVLMGGPGSEREVSLATGRGVAKALRSLDVEVVEIDVRNEDFQLPNDVDLAFNTIHGKFSRAAASLTPAMVSLRARSLSTRFAPKKNFGNTG